MIQRLSHAAIYVLDQDSAYDFYVNKLGFEVRDDQKMDNGFRWLTVAPKGQPDLKYYSDVHRPQPHDGPGNIGRATPLDPERQAGRGRVSHGRLQKDASRTQGQGSRVQPTSHRPLLRH